MPEPLLRLSGVSLIRDGRQVLDQIDWTVNPGEHWFILGKNGSGKTSLLEVLMGYLWASRGSVRVLGETYGKTYLPELRKELGYIAPWVIKSIPRGERVWEVVAAGQEGGLRFFGDLTRDLLASIEHWLRLTGCLDYLETPFERLSSGEQLRVLIARSFIRSHGLLILDEAFSALDLGARRLMYGLLSELVKKDSGPSILLVTHHLEEILPFYTHGLLLKDGKVYAAGEKGEILTPDKLSGAFDVTAAAFRGASSQ